MECGLSVLSYGAFYYENFIWKYFNALRKYYALKRCEIRFWWHPANPWSLVVQSGPRSKLYYFSF